MSLLFDSLCIYMLPQKPSKVSAFCSFAHRYMNRLSTKSEQTPVYIVTQTGHDSKCFRISPHVFLSRLHLLTENIFS
jgi:hypothetical protein